MANNIIPLPVVGSIPSFPFSNQLQELTRDYGTAAQLMRLGGVTLHGHECPEELRSAYKHRAVVQEFVGGGRSVQALGNQPGAIRWSGRLYPQHEFYNAQTKQKYEAQLDPIKRMLELQYIEGRGEPVELVFGPLRWTVFIHEFESKIVNVNQVDYAIELIVIDDLVTTTAEDANFPAKVVTLGEDSILTQLRQLVSTTQQLINQVEQNRIYAIIAVELASAIRSGDSSIAALAGLIAADTAMAAIGAEVSLISIANQIAEEAILIELFTASFSEEG